MFLTFPDDFDENFAAAEKNVAASTHSVASYRMSMWKSVMKSRSSSELEAKKKTKPMSKTEEKARAVMSQISDEQLQNIITMFLATPKQRLLNDYRVQDPHCEPGEALFENITPQEISQVRSFSCDRCFKLASFPVKIHEEMVCFYHKQRNGWCCRNRSLDFCQLMEPCQSAPYHMVNDSLFIDSWRDFATTQVLPDCKHLVVALDCEMVYTEKGLQLARVTVVDFEGECIYESLVRPKSKILDYMTEFSGIHAETLKDVTTTIKDVQQDLLKLISSNTAIVGHSLENDLKHLKLFHTRVIDTSLLFPHRNGPPMKRALRTLAAEFLGCIIQTNLDNGGHDSLEDAVTALNLFKLKLFEHLAKLKVDKSQSIKK